MIGFNRGDKVKVYGGNDMEMGYDGAAQTIPFVDGYGTEMDMIHAGNYTSGVLPKVYLMNFGDAAEVGAWTDEQRYYISWGALYDVIIPQVFYLSGAQRWTAVKIETGHRLMRFAGVLTTCNVASDPLPPGSPSGTCQVRGIDPNFPNTITDGASASFLKYGANRRLHTYYSRSLIA